MLFPDPCVCQMIPPSLRRMCSCAALIPKYWWTRVFLPFQEEFLGRPDGAVLEAFRVIASEDELDSREEPLVELGLLI